MVEVAWWGMWAAATAVSGMWSSDCHDHGFGGASISRRYCILGSQARLGFEKAARLASLLTAVPCLRLRRGPLACPVRWRLGGLLGARGPRPNIKVTSARG